MSKEEILFHLYPFLVDLNSFVLEFSKTAKELIFCSSSRKVGRQGHSTLRLPAASGICELLVIKNSARSISRSQSIQNNHLLLQFHLSIVLR
jgi:hypothetical protein